MLTYGHATNFLPKLTTLMRDYIDLWPTMGTMGSTCLQQGTINLSDLNHIIFALRVSQILRKENNKFIDIFQTWPVLSQAK